MIEKSQIEHLLGLEFSHGTQDCYTMACRIFKDLLDMELTNYARPNDWWTHGDDLYLDNFKSEGFKALEPDTPLSELHPFDVFLVAIPDRRNRDKATPTNHCAIYLGGDQIIHHRLGILSERKTYQGAIRNFTTHIVRHKDVKYTPETTTTVDIMNLIPAHKRAKILHGNT